jgi:hypothetical protein
MSTQPIIKVREMAFPRLSAPDLDTAESFLLDFGMVRAHRTDDTLYMRGAGPAPYVHVIHKGAPAWVGFAFEAASRDLMSVHPTRLVFIWDHPAQKVEATRQYDALGGFLFRRAGSTAKVTSVMVREDEDPNLLLLAAAGEPQAVILWLYDLGVHGTAANRHPPRVTTLDPSFGCRNYGRGGVGVLACARAWRLASEK